MRNALRTLVEVEDNDLGTVIEVENEVGFTGMRELGAAESTLKSKQTRQQQRTMQVKMDIIHEKVSGGARVTKVYCSS